MQTILSLLLTKKQPMFAVLSLIELTRFPFKAGGRAARSVQENNLNIKGHPDFTKKPSRGHLPFLLAACDKIKFFCVIRCLVEMSDLRFTPALLKMDFIAPCTPAQQCLS